VLSKAQENTQRFYSSEMFIAGSTYDPYPWSNHTLSVDIGFQDIWLIYAGTWPKD
jgi:hypothetical protein